MDTIKGRIVIIYVIEELYDKSYRSHYSPVKGTSHPTHEHSWSMSEASRFPAQKVPRHLVSHSRDALLVLWELSLTFPPKGLVVLSHIMAAQPAAEAFSTGGQSGAECDFSSPWMTPAAGSVFSEKVMLGKPHAKTEIQRAAADQGS